MTTKTCFKCGQVKNLSDFYTHRRMADGHLNKCKECTKSDAIAARNANLDYYRWYDRERANLPHRLDNMARVTKAYNAKYPERRKANIAVGNAIRDGRLERWPCQVCGAKAVAHHPDYSRPLDVVWLCQPHHKEAHALVKHETP